MLKASKNLLIIAFVALCVFTMAALFPSVTHAQSSDSVPCPAQGVWPDGCIPVGPVAPPTGEPCPAIGKWPAGCVLAPPPPIGGEPCPASGRWPAGCIPVVSPPPPSTGEREPCPVVGKWPAGCDPSRTPVEETPTPSPSAQLPLPETLYAFRSSTGLWRMTSSDTTFQPFSPTPAGSGAITEVAVWDQDGRIAIGTDHGEIYVIRPYGSIETIVNVASESEQFFRINGLDWSPDGSKLAYTVNKPASDSEDGELSRHDGAWIVDINSGERTHIAPNSYFPPTENGFVATYFDPQWSPDGSKLLISSRGIEFPYYVWYDVTTGGDLTTIRDNTPDFPLRIMWTQDSKGWLVSGFVNFQIPNDYPSGLVHVDLETQQTTVLVDGATNDLRITNVQQVAPVGTPFAETELILDVMPFNISIDESLTHFMVSMIGFDGWDSRRQFETPAFCHSMLASWNEANRLSVFGCQGEMYLRTYENGAFTTQSFPSILPTTTATLTFIWGGANGDTISPSEPTPTPTPIPSPTPTPPEQFILSETLYAFDEKVGLWRMMPSDRVFQQLFPTPQDGGAITEVAVWEQDGRIAFGTQRGQIYVIRPYGGVETIIDVEADSGYPLPINGLDWSPDGSKLAFSVGQPDGRAVSVPDDILPQHDGAWIVDIYSGERTRISTNTYFKDDPHNFAVYVDPQWSPDGSKILLTIGGWEFPNYGWYDAAAGGDITHLNSFARAGHPEQVEWTLDSQGLLASAFSDSISPPQFSGSLFHINLATKEVTEIVDGHANQQRVRHVQQVAPVGTPFAKTELLLTVSSTDVPIGPSQSHTNKMVLMTGFDGWARHTPFEGASFCDIVTTSWNQANRLSVWGCRDEMVLRSYENGVFTTQPFSSALSTVPLPEGSTVLNFIWGGSNAQAVVR